MNTNRH